MDDNDIVFYSGDVMISIHLEKAGFGGLPIGSERAGEWQCLSGCAEGMAGASSRTGGMFERSRV